MQKVKFNSSDKDQIKEIRNYLNQLMDDYIKEIFKNSEISLEIQ